MILKLKYIIFVEVDYEAEDIVKIYRYQTWQVLLTTVHI